MKPIIEIHNGVSVLRDDLLPGGTKSILFDTILDSNVDEYIYASPVYGGAQIALSHYANSIGKKATIFCAKRKEWHPNTKRCSDIGANIVEIPYGYLHVVQYNAKRYSEETGAQLLPFGLHTEASVDLISNRMREVIEILGEEPKEIWCSIGSGTLVEGILKGTTQSKVIGVQVGKEYEGNHNRLQVLKHPLPFAKNCKVTPPFPSTPNYDAKAWEFCLKGKSDDGVFFWNVL